MNRFVLLACLGALGCTRSSAPPAPAHHATPPGPVEADLSNNVAAALAGVLQRSGSAVVVNGDSLRVGSHTLRAHASVAQVIEEGDHTTAAVDVVLDVDGTRVDAFHTLAVAIDADRPEAIQHAVREWSVAYGMPIADALRGAHTDAGGSSRLTLGPFDVFAGPTGVRGEVPTNWEEASGGLHRALLDRLTPTLDALIPPAHRTGYHSIKITIHVRNASGGEGECLVDGAPNDRLCDLVRTYPWPPGPEEYIFKQFYVLAPAS